jgi:hypothetical protein
MAYTGDMPQQQRNSGMKTQRANCGCRFCFIASDHRATWLASYPRASSSPEVLQPFRACTMVSRNSRCWLKESHIRPYLLQILRNFGNSVHQDIQCFAAAATSNCVLMGDFISESDRANMEDIVSSHRIMFQRLLQHIADFLVADPRRARSRSASVAPLGVRDAPASEASVSKEMAAMAQTYLNSMKLSNLHTALYYPTLAEEYAMPANLNVLIGEDKHR